MFFVGYVSMPVEDLCFLDLRLIFAYGAVFFKFQRTLRKRLCNLSLTPSTPPCNLLESFVDPLPPSLRLRNLWMIPKLFDKYKAILDKLKEAKGTYEGYIESIEISLDFKEFEDMVDWAKLANVCYLT